MKIKLEEPYAALYDTGYLLESKSGRKYVTFTKDGKVVTTTSYARYLLSVKDGEIVPPHLEVDHIDGDRTNDNINNLQAITGKENRDKHVYERPSSQKHGTLSCYRYCRCNKCLLGKKLYSSGKIDEYKKLNDM